MEQRDYLLRQIQQMSQVLAALIRKLLGISDNQDKIEESTDEVFREQLDLTFEQVIDMPNDQLIDSLRKHDSLEENNLELIAEIFLLNAKAQNDEKSRENLLQKALLILNWLDKEGNTFSLERHAKIAEIQNMLSA